ncbi:nitric oxide synthase-like [Copidosoma floridanum]|uniref:nitric oxide synthase-like n=1 Tax=Copidosoma floridanum TaxID=29053 RepID=UPI000C6F959B|nr:nitric oxide synthase-like [Copidosoma floridanum]
MQNNQTNTIFQKSIKLQNHTYKTEVFDSLASKNLKKTLCSSNACLGSIVSLPSHGTEVRSSVEILKHAEDFLEQYFASIKSLSQGSIMYMSVKKY